MLRFIPQANLSTLDAIVGTQYVVRNAAIMVWDTLYGVNSKLEPQPQMAEGHEVSDDGKTWTFKLRPGLTFHDGEKVLPKDIIASLKRWMVRDSMGQIIAAQLVAMEGPDDLTFRIRMSKPFPKMLFALGKANPPMALVMPERIASTDAFKVITEFVGSGPMKFDKADWVPGSMAVFTKFDGYKPRDEPSDWSAGGKRMFVDRIEWNIITDPATAAGALQKGEVDWWENPIPDLVPLLKKNSNALAVDIADPLGNIGVAAVQPPATAVQRRAHPPRRADGAEPGRLHARRGRRRQAPVEGQPVLLHAGHAGLHDGWRRYPGWARADTTPPRPC